MKSVGGKFADQSFSCVDARCAGHGAAVAAALADSVWQRGWKRET